MELFLGVNPWFWFWVMIFFIIIEGISISAVSLWFALGALAACLLSFFTTSAVAELIVFGLVSLVSVFTLRRWALSKLQIGKLKNNTDELVDSEFLVVETISFPDGGRVKAKGTTWRCISDSNTVYEKGCLVKILRVEGVTLYIE